MNLQTWHASEKCGWQECPKFAFLIFSFKPCKFKFWELGVRWWHFNYELVSCSSHDLLCVLALEIGLQIQISNYANTFYSVAWMALNSSQGWCYTRAETVCCWIKHPDTSDPAVCSNSGTIGRWPSEAVTRPSRLIAIPISTVNWSKLFWEASQASSQHHIFWWWISEFNYAFCKTVLPFVCAESARIQFH